MTSDIRPATIADIPAMHELRLRVRENRLSDPGRVTEDAYRPYVAAGGAWVAEVEGRLVGFAIVDLAARSVWALFVAPEAEGRGIGRALHDHMLARAKALDIARLSLSTAPGTRAASFYRRAEWAETGVTAQGELRFERATRP